MQIRTHQDMRALVNWCIACCIQNNMLSFLGDVWEEEFEENDEREDAEDFIDVRFAYCMEFKERLKSITLDVNRRNGILSDFFFP